ncbi:MAG: hypothetical protein SFU21_16695 [Flavihumibacter sp.]|nr:hypothetical protein [Flavihumibacter sp.]
MERNFYNEDFEQYLKQHADQHKMYPSDRVWNNINNTLHPRKRWLTFGLLFLLVTSAVFIGREAALNKYRKAIANINKDLPITATENSSTDHRNPIVIDPASATTTKTVKPLTVAHSIYRNNEETGTQLQEKNSGSTFLPDNKGISLENDAIIYTNDYTTEPVLSPQARELNKLDNTIDAAKEIVAPANKNIAIKSITTVAHETQRKPVLQNQNAVITITKKPLPKWSLQLFAGPVVTFRKLSNALNQDEFAPVAITYAGGNLDAFVDHKPAVGYEFGAKAQYRLAPGIKLQTGLQLNYSRYAIGAYNYSPEKATIALSRFPNAPSRVSDYTSIRTFEGYFPENIYNRYVQLSIPIGAEISLLNRRKIQVGVAGTVQPAYMLNTSAFLISEDYRNYLYNPDLVRQWNIHTSFEAFVAYQGKNLKYQLGPQFRKQLVSSYTDKYPIREFLTEYGVRLSISRPFGGKRK